MGRRATPPPPQRHGLPGAVSVSFYFTAGQPRRPSPTHRNAAAQRCLLLLGALVDDAAPTVSSPRHGPARAVPSSPGGAEQRGGPTRAPPPCAVGQRLSSPLRSAAPDVSRLLPVAAQSTPRRRVPPGVAPRSSASTRRGSLPRSGIRPGSGRRSPSTRAAPFPLDAGSDPAPRSYASTSSQARPTAHHLRDAAPDAPSPPGHAAPSAVGGARRFLSWPRASGHPGTGPPLFPLHFGAGPHGEPFLPPSPRRGGPLHFTANGDTARRFSTSSHLGAAGRGAPLPPQERAASAQRSALHPDSGQRDAKAQARFFLINAASGGSGGRASADATSARQAVCWCKIGTEGGAPTPQYSSPPKGQGTKRSLRRTVDTSSITTATSASTSTTTKRKVNEQQKSKITASELSLYLMPVSSVTMALLYIGMGVDGDFPPSP
jgi:hypothetical protein